TLAILDNAKYWWPPMAGDVKRFVQGCSICAMSTTPRHLPEGKLLPLPVPHRPWTHLGVDFTTDLPPSKGFTTILVVIDRFSTACKFVPLKGLLTALETAEALFHHVFRHFGLPEDIVSDHRPQFISRVWREFFNLLGVSVSLSSGYHPQTNGQSERKIQELSRSADTKIKQTLAELMLMSTNLKTCLAIHPGHSSQSTLQKTKPTLHWSIPSSDPNQVTYRLKLPDHYRIAPSFHVSL
ncbi:hypothetical protein M9458_020625, partial [Cirrhinus mrigala]